MKTRALIYGAGAFLLAISTTLPAVDTTTPTTETTTPGEVKGGEVSYTITYDPNTWQVLTEKLSDDAEYTFALKGGNALGQVIAETGQIDIEEMEKILELNAIQGGADNVKVVSVDEKDLNGTKVKQIHMKMDFQGTPFDFVWTFFSGSEGTVQVMAWSSSEDYEQYKDKMQQLIDGFRISKK